MRMHWVKGAVLVSVLALPSPTHAANGMGEASWSDSASSRTLVTEASGKAAAGPAPYNWQCMWTALADSTIDASPKRGMCTEALVTLGSRVIGGPCAATFSVTMKVNRAVVDRVVTCNGTSTNQETAGLLGGVCTAGRAHLAG